MTKEICVTVVAGLLFAGTRLWSVEVGPKNEEGRWEGIGLTAVVDEMW